LNIEGEENLYIYNLHDSKLLNMSFFWFVSVFTITCTALVFFSISNQSMLNAFSQTVSTPFHEESGASDNQIASEFKFVTVGDWDCDEDTVNTINDITQRNPDLILALGDYSYENTADCWLKLVDPIDEKMKIVIGNHENKITDDEGDRVYSPELLDHYLNHFNLPNPYYSFDKGGVHFLVLSTETEYDEGSAQFRFAVDDLLKAANNPEVQWIIVAYHRTITYNSNTSAEDVGSSDFRDTYHPLFEHYSVDLVLMAHQHNYERTYPLQYNTDSPESPIITDRNKSYYNNPEGQVFAIIGTGGAHLFHFVGEAPNSTAERYDGFGLAEIKVTENPRMLKFTFFSDGERAEDTFIITKNPQQQVPEFQDEFTINPGNPPKSEQDPAQAPKIVTKQDPAQAPKIVTKQDPAQAPKMITKQIPLIEKQSQPGYLILTTNIINDNGGTKLASNFTINIAGNTSTPSFQAIQTPETKTVSIEEGEYLVYVNNIQGYRVSQQNQCEGDIKSGEVKTCLITIDDVDTTIPLSSASKLP
jgi:hypothetical protein